MSHRGLVASFVVSAFALVAGCGGSTPSGTGGGGSGGSAPTFNYPRDGVLRMNHLQLKGTHNSYHQPTADAAMVPALDYTHKPLDVQLESQGVRQFELDTHWNQAKGVMEVYHLYLVDEGTSCRLFTDCLKTIKAWSDKNPAHEPLFIQIEPKDSPTDAETAETYFGNLEGEVLQVFPRSRVITPDDVRGQAANVRDALAAGGWPTLGSARGKIAFFIDNHEGLRDFYTHGAKDLAGRLMFIDAEPTDPWAGIILANDPVGDTARITAALKGNLLIRSRADSDNDGPLEGDTTQRDAAIASGAHFISTDYPVAVPGVPMSGPPYVVEIPGGTPSRCNPLTAPQECASEDIEDPKFIQ
ncbi:MAG: Ca2+-dependent phosphoinositide-specific phospholipase C [Minicystis sp.]